MPSRGDPEEADPRDQDLWDLPIVGAARKNEREEIAAMVEAHGCQCGGSWDDDESHEPWCPAALAAAIRARAC